MYMLFDSLTTVDALLNRALQLVFKVEDILTEHWHMSNL